ncbi:hypothetical protein ACJJTC_007268 [Scirpophaga incertulas]
MSAIEDASQKRKNGVDLDQILVKQVGQFGRYQMMILTLIILPVIFSAFTSGEYIFTTARIPTRCFIDQCDGESPDFSAPWVSNAIPQFSNGLYDNCARFANSTIPVKVTGDGCPNTLFNNNITWTCDTYVYNNTHSVVYDFNLACDDWRRSRIGSLRNIGRLLAMPATGFVSDRWGRRVALGLNAFNSVWIGLARSFVNSYEWFTALEVIEAMFGAGIYSSCYLLVTELVGPKYRVMVGAALSTTFSIGQVILSAIAWAVPQWRKLTQVLYLPQLFVVVYFWFMSESVRWLMSKGRYEDAEIILKRVAKTNNKELSEKSLKSFRESAEIEKNTVKLKEQWLPIQVIKSRVIFSRCLVTPVWWVTNSLVYSGMLINSINLSGNPYLNYAMVSAIGIPAHWTTILLLDVVGRKPVVISGYMACAVCQFLIAVLPEDKKTLLLVIYLVGKFCISVVIVSVYIYTVELYPTKYRHSLFAFSSMVGQLGGITAPLTPALALEVWLSLPSVIFGIMALLSAMLVVTTPETVGIKLPNTMQEAENLSLQRTS